jgi:site-specific DNA-methyltransferase (adenine-specific)
MDLKVMDGIYNQDCIQGAREHLPDKCINLGIHDPPFGIGEANFHKLYNRKKQNVIAGYVEAPANYDEWTLQWMTEAKRVLRDDGSIYVVAGHSALRAVLDAAHQLHLVLINQIVYRFNFGVHTTRKFVTSHYNILYLAKSLDAARTFNTCCRRTPAELDIDGNSLLEADLSSVWRINREFHRGKKKNCNKLPNELVRKMIQYSSNPGDTVCDFFLGNFTTGVCARRLGRRICGFEQNATAYQVGMQTLRETVEGCDLPGARTYEPQPVQQR